MPRGTRLRNVRVGDDLWNAAAYVAEKHGTDLSRVIRDALQKYIEDDLTDLDGFRLVSRTHEECAQCDREVRNAVAMARVTGSVGATYGNDEHRAEVAR